MMTPGEIIACAAVVFAGAVVAEVLAVQEILDFLRRRRKGKKA